MVTRKVLCKLYGAVLLGERGTYYCRFGLMLQQSPESGLVCLSSQVGDLLEVSPGSTTSALPRTSLSPA